MKRLFLLRTDAAALQQMGGALTPEERQAVMETFLRECKILSSANHPNVLKFYGIVMDAGRQPLYLVTELVKSGSLRDMSCDTGTELSRRYAVLGFRDESGVLNYSLTIDALLDVFMALDYLHSRQYPVLHRDIKPANVLVEVTQAGFQKAILADLGEAKQVVFSTRAGQSLGSFGVGTLVYMAPEMKEAEEFKGPKLDIFSCGVMAAELATGRTPSPGPEMVRQGGRRVAVLEEERRKEDIDAVANEAFRAAIIQKSIVDDPDGRGTASELIRACQLLQRSEEYVAAKGELPEAGPGPGPPEAIPPFEPFWISLGTPWTMQRWHLC